jgi:hypothetical protein
MLLVAQLAAAIAERSSVAPEPFTAYAEAHRNRVVTPIFFMGGGNALKSIQWSQAPEVTIEVLRLRRYLNGSGRADSRVIRESRVKASVERILTLMPTEEFEEQRAIFVDGWVAQLVDSI